MDLTIITKLVSIILAVSLASERLVAFVTTLIPELAAPQPPGIVPPTNRKEKWRKVTLMLIALAAGWITISFKDGVFNPLGAVDIGLKDFNIPFFIIGLMASGGSAFWTSLLGYLKAVRDVNTQKNLQESIRSQVQIAQFNEGGFDLRNAANGGIRATSLRTIRFTAKFSGGLGTVTIQSMDFPDVNFQGNGSQDVEVPQGRVQYVISGATAEGNGALKLDITGPVVSDAPHNFGPGLIKPNIFSMRIS